MRPPRHRPGGNRVGSNRPGSNPGSNRPRSNGLTRDERVGPRQTRVGQQPGPEREESMHRRSFVVGSSAAAVLAREGWTRSGWQAWAQEAYPIRAITLINPFPPGGAAAVVARPLAAVLEPALKQPVVIETKAGAAGQVGAQFAASAKPDGYTLLVHIVSISGFAEVDKLYGRPVKFTRDDFIPLARLIADPMVLLVNDQQPYKSLAQLVDDARQRPNELIYSSSGLHGALHLPTALFLRAAGLQMKHLPTNGGGPALTALIGNNAQMACSAI